MTTDKFLSLNPTTGIVELTTAINASAGAGDAAKIMRTNSAGKVDVTLLPTGVGPETVVAVASEALSAGEFVNVYDVATVATCRKADASNDRPADGFVLASVASAANATIYTLGQNTAVTGFTAGDNVFLSGTTAGAGTTTPPTTGILQRLGRAMSATVVSFEPDPYIDLTP